jgi:hypothetical protein
LDFSSKPIQIHEGGNEKNEVSNVQNAWELVEPAQSLRKHKHNYVLDEKEQVEDAQNEHHLVRVVKQLHVSSKTLKQ